MEEHTSNIQHQISGKKVKQARIIFIFFSVLTGLSILYCVFYPRGRYVFVTILFLLCWIVSLCNIRSKKGPFFPTFLYPVLFSCALFMAYVLPVIFLFECYFSARWPWEYEKEMEPYREIHNNVFYFPETIPECATQVEFHIMPSYMQAKGHLILSFVADDAYIQQCIEGHRTQFEQFNDLGDFPEGDRDALYKDACVDLYSLFKEKYYEDSYQEYCNTFSISTEEAMEQILDLPNGVELTLEELESATQYHIDAFQGQRGFIIIKATNKIIYYRDFESM